MIFSDSLVQLVESVRDLLDHRDTKLLTECRDVVISHATERLRILLEGQIRRPPFLEELGKSVGRLSSDHEQTGIQLLQGTVQILQALQQEPASDD